MSASINVFIESVENHYDADIFLLCDAITEQSANFFQTWTRDEKCKKHKNALLILRTYGGSPDAGYKIARSIQTAYKCKTDSSSHRTPEEQHGIFYLFVNGPCKSAGTLIATGADTVLMTDRAEFGPIDMQIRKPEEAGERTSGLVTIEAFDPLRKQALKTFCEIFHHLRYDANFGLSSKIAADIANNLTVGLLGNVYAQIDPLRVAELDRTLRIGAGYAERLSHGNLHDEAIGMLLAGYPSHSFVIDKEEAKRLFRHHLEPIDDLVVLGDIFCGNGPGQCYPLKPLSTTTDPEEAEHVGKDNEGNHEDTGRAKQKARKNTEPAD